ncbi:MAG: YgiQ family radical SAM protein [Oscillospiraceae bacterium]|nr:YgiQ family radical SAM protein [Oscillospiraceae bacterium]
MAAEFLPVSREDMARRDWYWYDFLLVTGDAYVDHPSFGTAIIGRVLESEGFRVAVLAQPDWHSCADFAAMGKPRYGVLISGGNVDSMVANYTVAKRRRVKDTYSPGARPGLRPDRAVIVYSNLARQAFGRIPVVIGGLEASLRRFAHYDYWEDRVRRSVLQDCGADLLSYGMGENSMTEIAHRLAAGEDVHEITDVRGTAFLARSADVCRFPSVTCPGFHEVSTDKEEYARAAMLQYREHDPVRGRAVIQDQGDRILIVNPPAYPLTTEQLDRVAELPYVREAHPMYDELGGVPSIREVRFSVIHNRGCFGACNFCSLAFHQGRIVSCRSHESVLREVEQLTRHPGFKGYIHDVGGPTANFRHPSCEKQLRDGMCPNRACLAPEPCPNLDAGQDDYLTLLQEIRAVPGVKKVFIRSGIRFDYLLLDPDGELFGEIVQHHVSGQLKVAPEHCVSHVLDCMGKPHIEVYEEFQKQFEDLNRKYGKDQYLVPYLISSHPGCTLSDAVSLAEWLNRAGRQPEQVQDFYPTPGTLSTCMYYTGIDPRTMKSVYVPKDPHEKAMQRALLQWKRPEKRQLVLQALRETGREDLIGWGEECLLRPDRKDRTGGGKEARTKAPKKRKTGWAVPKEKKGKPRRRK